MKTKNEILEKLFITTNDLQVLTGFCKKKCQDLMKEMQEKAKEENIYYPEQRKLVVPTKLVKKKFKL